MIKYVIIDNGHGRQTRGKCSPDGRLREWEWTRKAARKLVGELKSRGLEAVLLVPEDDDVPLRERCRRANAIAAEHVGAVLISLHTNAAGDGKHWTDARGWSSFVARGAGAEARRLAAGMWRMAKERGFSGNRCVPPAGYYERDFAICRCTHCPAVLTENLFHDNIFDAGFLMSDEGVDTIVRLHADAIMAYNNVL